VAGATITIRIMMFTLMPAWGMSNAAATLVGQNLGAARPDRAEASVWRIGWYNMAFMVCVSAVLFLFHHRLIGLFTDDAGVIAVGGEWLRILSYSYFVYGWWMVSVQAFNGAGDTVTPTRINWCSSGSSRSRSSWLPRGRSRLAAVGRVLGRVHLGDVRRPLLPVAVQRAEVEDGAVVSDLRRRWLRQPHAFTAMTPYSVFAAKPRTVPSRATSNSTSTPMGAVGPARRTPSPKSRAARTVPVCAPALCANSLPSFSAKVDRETAAAFVLSYVTLEDRGLELDRCGTTSAARGCAASDRLDRGHGRSRPEPGRAQQDHGAEEH
jgi:hypothetical protein